MSLPNTLWELIERGCPHTTEIDVPTDFPPVDLPSGSLRAGDVIVVDDDTGRVVIAHEPNERDAKIIRHLLDSFSSADGGSEADAQMPIDRLLSSRGLRILPAVSGLLAGFFSIQ